MTPGFKRAKTRRLRPSRSCTRLANVSGAHISARVAQNGANLKSGGITPMIVKLSPLSVIRFHNTFGSRP